jgi:hypothetical protein
MKNLSTTGYKKNSPDKDKPYNVIPSGEITMEDVEFPVLGIDNLGNEKVMAPGEKSISYPGDTVLEFPLLGKALKNKSKIYNKIFKK